MSHIADMITRDTRMDIAEHVFSPSLGNFQARIICLLFHPRQVATVTGFLSQINRFVCHYISTNHNDPRTQLSH